jgi:hypothetical protein
MKINIFCIFIFFYGFSTQHPNIISKAPTLYSAKVLSRGNLEFVDLVLQGV